jgi:hypothetical protein
VPSDLLLAVDGGDTAALVLLDLSTVLDTVDHAILLMRLWTSFSLDGLVGFSTFVEMRVIRRGASSSVICNVPQGSVLGAICLFYILLTWLVS